MRRSLAVVLVGALFAGLAVLLAAPASACSCAGASTAQYLASADAVFVGRLESREVSHPPGDLRSSTDPAVHVFAVETVFAGAVTERQEVVSPDSGASCGLELSGTGPYVVFGTRSAEPGVPLAEGQYEASLCGGTAPLTPELEEELRSLAGPGEAPRTGSGAGGGGATPAAGGDDDRRGWLLGMLVAAAAAAGAGIAWRRSRAARRG